MPASQADAPLQQRLRAIPREQASPARPPDIQSDVLDADGRVRIVIPLPRLNPFAAVAMLFPAAIATTMLGWLGFFSTTRALTPGEWIFFGVVLSAFIKGQGIIVKTRKGLTTFGEGLSDDEIRYLHGVIERALAGGNTA